MANMPAEVKLVANVKIREEDIDQIKRLGDAANNLIEDFQRLNDNLKTFAERMNALIEDHPTLFTD